MNIEYLEQFIHLHLNPDLAPEVMGAALAVRQIHTLVTCGGSYFDHPEKQSSVSPEVVLQCIKRGMGMGGPFHEYWQKLHTQIIQLTSTWEKGKQRFHEDLAHATEYDELDLLLTEESVCKNYADATAHSRYWNDYPQKQWFLNGYMVAWREWQQQEKTVATI